MYNFTAISGEIPVTIDGYRYWTIQQYAKLTGRSESHIRILISRGNSVRKLDAKRFGGKPFIPVEELFAYPFVGAGRPTADETGRAIYAVEYYRLDGGGKLVTKQVETPVP